MSLKKEMPSIVVTGRRATRIMIQNEVRVFIRLGSTAIVQVSESRDWARGILEQIAALLDESREQTPANKCCR